MADSDSLEQAAQQVIAALRTGDGVSDETARQLFTAGVIAYGARRLAGKTGSPLSDGHGVAATDVAIVTTAMLEDVNIAIFELGLWQSMAGKK